MKKRAIKSKIGACVTSKDFTMIKMSVNACRSRAVNAMCEVYTTASPFHKVDTTKTPNSLKQSKPMVHVGEVESRFTWYFALP